MSLDPTTFYTISVEGVLDGDLVDWFEGMTIAYPADLPRRTVLSGYVPDQAALHGMLERIRDLNLPLIGVWRVSQSAERGGA